MEATEFAAPDPGGVEQPGAASPGPIRRPRMLAAVDLGSNSFRMVIARLIGEELSLLDRLRAGVRLAGCLDKRRRLTDEGKARALDCLEKFGQRVRDFPPGSVRAVGTNTLRKARNTDEFLPQAEAALGHPIEVISGQEEARLIYLGACHSLPAGGDRRLVVDIGGGSTECIVGEDFEPLRAESLYMGCVGHTLKFFPGGKISRKRMRKAEIAARLELRPGKADFRTLGWRHAAGASGTVQAVDTILRLNEWSDHGITFAGLKKLREKILAASHVDELKLQGLRKERSKVLPGGVAILSALFKSLRIERLTVSSGALREGVLHDLLGRIRHKDVRDRTIQHFIEQYHVEVAQARRVERTALYCLEQIAETWELEPKTARAFLKWGASLHEIGLAIAHAGYHKHGAYLIDHSDLPGFSYQDQSLLALLVRSVRRKFPRALFEELPESRARFAVRLSILLRLSVLLNRSRSPRAVPDFRLSGDAERLVIRFPQGWLAEHALTRADLKQEIVFLKGAGIKLKIGKPLAD